MVGSYDCEPHSYSLIYYQQFISLESSSALLGVKYEFLVRARCFHLVTSSQKKTLSTGRRAERLD